MSRHYWLLPVGMTVDPKSWTRRARGRGSRPGVERAKVVGARVLPPAHLIKRRQIRQRVKRANRKAGSGISWTNTAASSWRIREV